MKKIYIVNETTELNKYKFSKKDILFATDIQTYINLKKKILIHYIWILFWMEKVINI